VATVPGTTPVTFGARLAVNGIWNAAALVVLNVEMGAIQWMMGSAARGTLEGRVWPWSVHPHLPNRAPEGAPGALAKRWRVPFWDSPENLNSSGRCKPPDRPYALV
jgi:hypothetical protein